VLIISVGLRKVPNRTLRLVVVPTAQNPAPRMIIDIFVGPLPYVADHIDNTERTRASEMSIHVIGRRQSPSLIRHRNIRRIPCISPGIKAVEFTTLRCVLPLPLVG
jgi:hypothetical protein